MKKFKKTHHKPDEPKQDLFVHPNTFHIHTDGSYRPEGNAACAYLIYSERTKHLKAVERFAFRNMTINQMELMAINKALDYPYMDHVLIYSDSAYSIGCLTAWYKTWERNGWLDAKGEPVKNKELIQEILAKMKTKKFCRFVKIKAHSGNFPNTVVDYLASGLTALMVNDPTISDGPYPV